MSVAADSIKECSECGNVKQLVAFATYKTRFGERRRRGVCKQCRDARAKQNSDALEQFRYRQEYNSKHADRRHKQQNARRLVAKTFVDKYKSSKSCVDCGVFFPPVAMDFDHVRGGKEMNIATMVSGAYKLELIIEEIKKCDLVCACCHRIRTHTRKENVCARISFRATPTESPKETVRLPEARRGEKVSGSKNVRAKLTESKVELIRRKALDGARPKNLAVEFGVSALTIYGVLRRDTWKHVEGGVRADNLPNAYKHVKRRVSRTSERLTVLT